MSSTTGEADKLSSLTSAQSCHHFSLAEIQSATNDFDDELVIGKGGFGKVYKGRICVEETNHVVAIKRLDSMSDQGAPEFRTEIEILSKLRHRHLVSLIGFCHDNKEMILVYEYMPHGTLYHHLHKADTHLSLSWEQRLKIAIGAGRGLDYLHTGVGVIHRDVKSSNILLDANLEARISDFGLSKVGPTNQSSSCVDASVKGTFGYLDPEYYYTRKLTRKTDVFAFGVLLFELLSGRRAVDERFGEEQCSLVRWAQKCVKDRKLDQMVDSSIRGMILPKCLRRFAQIADRCLYSVPKERSTMTEVVASLQVLLELQRKNDDSGESSGTMGFTWKIHEYLVPTTKQHSDNVRNMRARMRQLDGTSIDVMKHKDRKDMNAWEVLDRVPSWLEEVATIKRQVESISSNDNKRSNMIVRYQVGRDALKTTLEIERLLKEGLKICCSEVCEIRCSEVCEIRCSEVCEIRCSDAQKPLARFDYLKDDQEAKEIFLLCGLFPEDSNIRIEDLTRYAWGLQLLTGVSTLEDARDRTEACVSRLKNAHLLINSDDPRCVKLHDLVLDFVLDTVSKGDRASLIKHGDISTWSPNEMTESYRRISLLCNGLHEFPEGFKSPNLSLLKLMNGDDSFQFPEDFYGNTEKLEVMAYEKFQYPWLSRLLQCSTNLRTLCLHHCKLMIDCSFIGNLVNLEVLSFFNSTLRELPSSVGNLKKLKVLDLTGCDNLRCINDGVLKNLVKLEEIYMRDIEFTERNSNELAGRSKNLLALEIKCFENKGQLKNMSYENLKRFKIYMGNFDRSWTDESKLFGNKLYLVTNKDELLESGMNGLLEKTEELCLEVDGMTNLEDIEVKSLHSPQYSSFCNLRSLMVSKCAELRYIFTLRVATALSKLEYLDISLCHSMKELIHIESSESETIKFPKLKFLSLDELPNLLSLCNTINVIELPQLMDLRLHGLPNFTSIYSKKKLATSSMAINDYAWRPFLNEEVVVPKLEKLCIHDMENLKEIWSCQYSSSKEADVCILREIDVKGCDSLVNLFPSNPMTLMQHLEDLKVANCGSIEALFNIDLGCVGEIEEVSCRLRSIRVQDLGKLREVWRIKGANNSGILIHCFQAVESLEIKKCMRFRNVFTPTTTNFDMRVLKRVVIRDCGERERNNELVKSNQQQKIDVISNEEISEVGDIISSVVFPSYLIRTFHHVQTLNIYRSCEGAETVFEMDSPSSRELATNHATQQLPLLPDLEDIRLEGMNCMSHVWKCNWNEFLIIQRQQQKCSFHNLTTIHMIECRSIKYLFSPLMAELLCNLKKIHIHSCVIEEVVSNRDEEVEEMTTYTSTNTSTNLFPCLDILTLISLPNLQRIGGGGTKGVSNEISFNNTTTTLPIHDQFQFSQVDISSWSLCQYSRKIDLLSCHALSSAIPFNAIGQMQKLERLTIWNCDSLVEVFETQRNFDEGSDTTLAILRPKNINVPKLSNLKELEICGCNLLQHVFTFATLESLQQLHELKIERCEAMKVIVKEESDQEQTTPPKVVVFGRLKSIALVDLPTLTGFFLGMNDFQWPLLDEVKIDACPQMTVFTRGCSEAPKVNNIYTKLGKHSLECGLNFPQIKFLRLLKRQEWKIYKSLGKKKNFAIAKTPCSSLDGTGGSYPTTSEGIIRWSFNNLIEIDVKDHHDGEQIIPSNELLQVQKLERIRIVYCDSVKEVFEAMEDSGLSELPFVVKIPKLREVELKWLHSLKYIWKSNPWMVLEFPNLTKVTIDGCNSLEHVFSSSMVGSLLQLQELFIMECVSMEVIVEEENVVVQEGDDAKVNNEIIMLPGLKSLQLKKLPCLKGFYLGKEAFSWPSLETLKIEGCPVIRVFTKGHSATPQLKVIDTGFGRCELQVEGEDQLNSFINTKQQEGFQLAEVEDKPCSIM